LVDRWASSVRSGLLEVSGVGGSELPARLLVTALADAGLPARFVALSRFVVADVPMARAAARVVFSQSLSPNARLALHASTANPPGGAGDAPATMLLVSARDEAAAGPSPPVLVHGPEEESGLLLRVIGPLQACLLAADLAMALRGVSPTVSPETLRVALARAAGHADIVSCVRPDDVDAIDERPVVLLTEGIESELGAALALKLVEGLGSEARAGDALGFAHGTLQSIYNRRVDVVLLTREGSSLRERVRSVLVPERHALIEHHAMLPFPYAVLERAAFLDRLVLNTLEQHPAAAARLAAWPGQGADGALYHLGATT
jgi:hypothetical protein